MMNDNAPNKSKTLLWYDTDNRDSYLLCLAEYDIKLLHAIDVDKDTVEITIYGKAENVNAFVADAMEDAIEPLNSMSNSLEFDEDYEAWLNNEVYHITNLLEMFA